MLVPLGVLTLGAVAAGFLFSHAFLDRADFWQGSIFYNEPLIHAMHGVPLLVKLSATIAMVIGLALAWLAYIKNTTVPEKTAEQLGPIYRFLYNKWYFDELYRAIFVRPAFWFGQLFWQRGDVGLIDRFGPNGAARLVSLGSVAAKRMQTGYLYSYALVMLLGLVAAVTWVLV
jgi:NADH-quinone oxidoreductase subunit L